MNSELKGSSAFSYIQVELAPGESITAESDAMVSMDVGIEMKARLNGNVFAAIFKALLGGESLFVNEFTNPTNQPQKLTLVQGTPGEIKKVSMKGESICLQPGAYIASSPGLKLGMQWAGFKSWFAREGLFKLVVEGEGELFYGAYGGLVEKEVDGDYIVDTAHLVAYDPQLKLNVQLAGGLFASFFSGEGFVTRVEGKGKIVLQSRSLSGLVGWLNPKLY